MIVLDFLRFGESGSVERVTWLKTEDGNPKFLIHITGHNPTDNERKRMLESSYGQTII